MWLMSKLVPPGVPECVAVRNPLASSDGQHSRAGNNLGLRLALVPPSDGPQSLWYTRPMLMQGRAT